MCRRHSRCRVAPSPRHRTFPPSGQIWRMPAHADRAYCRFAARGRRARRAWEPSQYRWQARSFTREHATGDGDVFTTRILRGGNSLRQRTFVAHLGELYQHRQVDAGQYLDFRPAHDRDGKIRRCPAKHVGQNGDPFAAVYALDRLDYVLSALLDVIVRSDGHGFDLSLWPDDVFQCRAELDREAPVGDQDKTDHETPRGAHPVAPRKAAIMTIRSPFASAPR